MEASQVVGGGVVDAVDRCEFGAVVVVDDAMLDAVGSGAMGLGFFQSDDDPWTETGDMARDIGLDACAGG